MIVLGIETSTPSGGVALLEDERLLACQAIRSAKAHSRLLLPATSTLLRELNLTLDQVDAVAVSSGPGSFTGVRVAMSVGKALCETGRPRLVLVPTLDALACRAWAGEPVNYVMPLLNAKQGRVYGAIFASSEEGVGNRLGEEFDLKPDEVAARWPGKTLLAGEGALAYTNVWETLPGDTFLLARPDRLLCGPEQVALLGLRAAQAGRFADPAQCLPVYLREATVSKPRPRSTPAAKG